MDTTVEEEGNITGLEGEDVIGLDYVHIECKRVQKLNIEEALQQAKKDSKNEQMPAVFHRKNGEKLDLCQVFGRLS